MKVSIDSRTISKGDYFIPVKGENFDGYDFVDDVIAKGGHVLDVDLAMYAKAYRKKLTCKVIAIVGSAGKTTVKDMVASVLSQQFSVVKTEENQNNEFGVPLTILSAEHDTDFLLVEMGMRKKHELKFLTQLAQPDVIIFTGVGKTHIEFFKSQYQLALAKAEVFRSKLKWQRGKRLCFLGGSGDYYDLILAKADAVDYHVITYTGDDKVAENINLCYQLGAYYGIDVDKVELGIATCKRSVHRMAHIQKNNVLIIDDTYNSNPSGVLYAFQYLARFTGRKIAVLGDMLELGDYSQKEHQAIGKLAIDYGIDMLFLYGQAMSVLQVADLPFYHFEDKVVLTEQLKTEIKMGDTVLVKGSRSLAMEDIVDELDHGLF
tara:strand:- start:5374 stop:6501 length:1128 start_codon:yes stop_codon:yes gene_type:complete